MGVLIFFLIFYILLSISLYLLFPKAGVDAWKGLVPGLNFMEWCKIIGRKPLYALWLLVPIVNIFIFSGMAVDMVRSFMKLKFIDSAAAVVLSPFKFAAIAMDKDSHYQGKTLDLEKEYVEKIKEARDNEDKIAYNSLTKNNPYKKGGGREWAESIIFAVFAAAFIRMFLIEAYVIPTPSMEGSLNVGDFLFVSKAHYGIRTPMTIAMVPLLHNTIPVIKKESYLKKPSLKYKRLKALETIDNNDPIVFNWPVGDSVYLTPRRSWTIDQARRLAANPASARNYPELMRQHKKGKYRVRPIDKKDHYIKRCLAIPGDSLEIKNRQVFINGKEGKNPENLQFKYQVYLPTGVMKSDLEGLPFMKNINQYVGFTRDGKSFIAFLSEKDVNLLKEKYPEIRAEVLNRYYNEVEAVAELTPSDYEKRSAVDSNFVASITPTNSSEMFPNDPKNFGTWTVDNFGPIYIPEKGATVTITANNIALYKRIITVYEGNDLKIERGRVIINGEQTTQYTFKQNYYWAMGDNRHNSEDSRSWGYVPEDHMVGKPLFIWFSLKNGRIADGINFKRIFKSANVQ